jgi:hypothetical protein
MAVPSQTSYMLTYDLLLTNCLPSHSISPLFAGMIARTCVSTAFSPLELLRTRLQASPESVRTPRTLQSSLASIRSMVHVQGWQSLWRGLPSTLWRDVPFSGIYWTGYEQLKAAFSRAGYDGNSVSFTCGALSGSIAAVLTSPFDVIKTRRQAFLHTHYSMGTLSVLQTIVRLEGYRTLFTGLSPRLAKIAPACGIMISCYEVSYISSFDNHHSHPTSHQ